MRIIIAGGSDVGLYLAKLFEHELHEVILIESRKDTIDLAEKTLGVATVLGDSTSYKTLKEAKVETANLLVAVTETESTNITTCLIAKKLGAKYTIARISNMEYLIDKKTLDLRSLGIDELISPESLAAREVKHILAAPELTETFELEDGRFVVMGLRIDQNSPIVNKTIIETVGNVQSKAFTIIAIQRRGETLIPTGKTQFFKGDHIYFIATSEGRQEVLEYAGKKPISIESVLIIGGSRTGKYIAHRLSRYFRIKLIEKDLEKCNSLARILPNVQIVNGDGTNVKLLEEERIDEFDAFVSVTGNSETNIFTCLVAKELGAKKTIAMVENIALFDHSQKIGIDTLINKKLATANFIFRSIHKGGVLSHLYGVDAEILEFNLKVNSVVTNKPISELKMPENSIVGGVVRGNVGVIPTGNFRLQSADKVLIVSLPKKIESVNTLFSKLK